jgi:hypothetical protein
VELTFVGPFENIMMAPEEMKSLFDSVVADYFKEWSHAGGTRIPPGVQCQIDVCSLRSRVGHDVT